MKKLIKIISLSITLLIALMIIGIIALVQLVNPNDYKAQIKTLAYEKANLNLNINGDINWSFYPYLGFNITDTNLTDATTKYNKEPLAQFKNIGISLKLLPLFNKELNIKNIYIDDLQVNVFIDKKGVSNFAGLMQLTSDNNDNNKNQQKDNNQTNKVDNKQDINFMISSISLNNLNLKYDNKQAGQLIKLNNFNLKTENIIKDAPISLNLDGNFILDKTIQAYFKSNLIVAFNNELTKFNLNIKEFNSDIKGEFLPNNKTAKFTLQTNINAVKNNDFFNIDLNDIKFSLNNLNGVSNLELINLGDVKPNIKGELNIKEFNLKQLLVSLGQELPKMANNNSLNKLSLNSKFATNDKNELATDYINLNFDQTKINANIIFDAFAKKPAFKLVKVQIDQINADDYLPPDEISNNDNNKDQIVNNEPFKWSEEIIFDQKLIFNNDILTANKNGLNLDLKLDKLTIKKIPINNLLVNINLNKSLLNIKTIKADIYSGNINLNGSLNNKAQTNINLTTQNLPLAKFIENFVADLEKSPVMGNLNLNAKLTTQGLSQKKIVSNLTGTSNLNITNAEIKDVNLELHTCEAIALLNRKDLDKSSLKQQKNTIFNKLGGNFNLKNGVVNNPDFNANTSGLNVSGRGDINLPNLSLNYVLGLKIEGDKQLENNPACTVNEKYADLEFPLLCKGSLQDMASACKIDAKAIGKTLEKMLKNKLEQKIEDSKIKEKVSEQKEALKEKVEEKLKDKIDDQSKEKLKKSLKKLIK